MLSIEDLHARYGDSHVLRGVSFALATFSAKSETVPTTVLCFAVVPH